MDEQTIFALSSGRGRSAIAVVRISGPAAAAALTALTGSEPPPPRRAAVRTLYDDGGGVLDRGLVLWFPAPASATGEPVCELHLHGGRACVEGVLAALSRLDGLRPATAGEFTRRAFVNGRLDLTQAEAVADLIAAETAAQRDAALRQLAGGLGRLYEGWRQRLLGLLAHLEAVIDFADEDLPPALDREVAAGLEALAADIGAHLADGSRGERLRDGIVVAILGAPNAGKSTLLNTLAGREAAIVSPHPGTTRDVIEVAIDLGGYPVVLADTAGLRQTGEDLEAEGVRRARLRGETADVRLIVVDGARYPSLDEETARLLADGGDALAVVSKADLLAAAPTAVGGRPALAVSALTGAGLDALVGALTATVGRRFGLGEAPVLTRARHRHGLERCREALLRAIAAPAIEERAEELRAAATALGRITGRIDVDNVLDRIFAEFCIGK